MATTINAYSVSLAMDASSYINASKLSRSETAALKRDINAARNPVEEFGRTYDRLEKALQSGAISLDTYQRLLDRARQKQQAATPAVESTAQAFARQNKELAKANQLYREQSSINISAGAQRIASANNAVGGSMVMLAGRFAGPLAGFAALKQAVQSSFETERAAASLEVLAGSADMAGRIMSDLRAIDAESPLSFDAGLQATRTLLGFGIEAEKVTGILRQLGDISGADNERFKSLALAFAQASAAGRLQGQDLRQMIDAGFNPLLERAREMSETMGVSVPAALDQLRQKMEAGQYTASMMAEDFANATSEGGRFAGQMDKLGQTAGGKFGQMMSKIQQLGVAVGDALAPAIQEFSELVIDLAPLFEPVIFALRVLADGLRFIVALGRDVFHIFERFFAMARGERVTLADMFSFENVSGMFGEKVQELTTFFAGAAESGGKLATHANATASAMGSAASSAERYKNAMQLASQYAKQTADNQKSNEDKLNEMEAINRRGGKEIDPGIKAEQEFILNSFDQTDTMQRNTMNTLQNMFDRGVDYQKLLGNFLSRDQLAQLEKFRELQRQNDALREQNRLQEEGVKLQEDFARQSAASALQNAQQFFEKQRQDQMKRRADFAKGPQGFEVGSSEAASYLAGLQNDRLAMAAVPPTPTPGDQELMRLAMQQMQQQAQADARQEAMLQALVEVAKQNGFKRIR